MFRKTKAVRYRACNSNTSVFVFKKTHRNISCVLGHSRRRTLTRREASDDRLAIGDVYQMGLIRSVKMFGREGTTFCLLLFLVIPLLAPAYRVKIGVIGGPGTDRRQNSEKFWSFGRNQSTPVALELSEYEVPYWSTLEVVKAVCGAAREGARALVMQGPPRMGPLLATYSERLGLPLVLDSLTPGRTHVSLLPDTKAATIALLRHYGWTSFAFMYDTEHGADQLQAILQGLGDPLPQVEAFWRAYNAEEGAAFARHLPAGAERLLLDTSEEMADQLFDKLAASGRSFHGILLRPVGIVKRGSAQGISKLTKFSYVDEKSELLKDLDNRWRTIEDWSRRPISKDLPDSALVTHDISRVLHAAFSEVARAHPESLRAPLGIDCFNYSSGMPTEVFQRNIVLGVGVTGSLQFDEQGQREGYTLGILESTPFSINKIGMWTDTEGLKISRQTPPTPAFQKSDRAIRVTSILVSPFLRRNPDGELEGYVVDFLDQLSQVIGRRFQLQLVKDGRYGMEKNGRWIGMIGELLNNETDLVVADLTKTPEREKVIQYCKSLMTVGLNILLHKPQDVHQVPSSFGPFSFLTVWPVELWLMVTCATILFGAACYAAARWVGAPDRVRALESKGTDSLSPCGSLWFTVGALLQRDTGIYPRSFTHRVWALLWWAFCFFVLVCYVSALSAALLTNRTHVTSTHSRKTSHEVIQDLLQTGSPSIGTIKYGSTFSFFKLSSVGVYRDLGRYLEEHPDAMANANSEGLERVRSSGGAYAFMTESSSTTFAANQPPCDLVVSSGFLTTRTFAPALRKNSTLKEVVDHGVLTLVETGVMRQLYEKWWHNYTDECEDPNLDLLPKVYSQSMTLHEVSGVFYILLVFAVTSVGAAFVEHFVSSNRLSLK
ncbi:glutamate receptor 4 [Nephila pilipes]|uniref:Glutamate receptor 4 n=1 Tax=Nephila pilipes TaxID=299642 RepID=A0A8X6PT30_NEPPI|nr:glutamate receptor 4 [Nephila pilipes]